MFIKSKLIFKLLIAIGSLLLMIANARSDKIEFNTFLAIIVFITLCSI